MHHLQSIAVVPIPTFGVAQFGSMQKVSMFDAQTQPSKSSNGKGNHHNCDVFVLAVKEKKINEFL
jgi:hypothetical protein